MNSTQVSVTTGAAVLLSGTTASAPGYPMSAIIKLGSGATEPVYLGGSSVTTGSGFQVSAGESVSVDIINEALYGIIQTSAQTVYILRRF